MGASPYACSKCLVLKKCNFQTPIIVASYPSTTSFPGSENPGSLHQQVDRTPSFYNTVPREAFPKRESLCFLLSKIHAHLLFCYSLTLSTGRFFRPFSST
ncbi:hypothetical protein CSKR_200840 [Clonorchis sinensis]|uniref:Uncharacterized protein n=1 Tax=Clonorchis sinensis TaxID=79923 RepID=A0A8T1MJG5_CLOSI|nr:hypothetical protein CSKR_200840 [Clonorchis sinensis]